MKRNLLILAIVLLIGFIVNSCDDEEKEPPVCNLGEHLGIGETCNGTNCSLQNYNTSTGANTFPKPIYRVGAKGNNGATLTSTASAIVDAYNTKIAAPGGSVKTRFDNSGLTEIQMYLGGTTNYTWSGSGGILGIRAGAFEIWMIEDLGTTGGLDKRPVAQLQPASYIRLMKGMKQTEQLSVAADYISNLKYATVVYKKL